MKEIQSIVNEKVAEMIESGSIQKKIEDAIESAIENAIESQFRSYGSITKQIEDVFENGLKIDQSNIDIPSYTAVMEEIINNSINQYFAGEATERFRKMIDEKLAPLPQEMSINDLVEMIVKEWKTDEPWNADDLDDYATVELNQDCGRDSHSLKMWKQKEYNGHLSSRENQPDVHLFIIKGKLAINHNMNPTCLHNEDAIIFKAYAQGVKFTGIEDFDEDDCDLTLKEEY